MTTDQVKTKNCNLTLYAGMKSLPRQTRLLISLKFDFAQWVSRTTSQKAGAAWDYIYISPFIILRSDWLQIASPRWPRLHCVWRATTTEVQARFIGLTFRPSCLLSRRHLGFCPEGTVRRDYDGLRADGAEEFRHSQWAFGALPPHTQSCWKSGH